MSFYRLQTIWKRARAGGVTEDVAVTTHDFLTTTELASGPEATALAAAENGCAVWFQTFDELITTGQIMDQWRWYKLDTTTNKWGSPVRVTEVETPGTATSVALPPQVAVSVTEKTTVRRRWGRFYIPGWTYLVLSGEGLVANSVVDGLSANTRTWYQTAKTAGLIPVVLTKQQAPLQFQYLDVTHVQVDNIADVIRRRRWENPTRRTVTQIT